MEVARLIAAIMSAIAFSCGVEAVVFQNVSEALDYFSTACDKRVRPLEGTGKPVVVKVSMYIGTINEINEDNMEFSATLYIRKKWNDPRLQYESGNSNLKLITVSGSTAQSLIWIPDLFFSNARVVEVGTTFQANTGLRILPNGDIFMSTMLTVTANCPMKHHRFPFDTQRCSLHLESYFSDSSGIDLNWLGNKSVVAADTSSLVTHTLAQISPSKYSQKYTIGGIETEFLKLTVDFLLPRANGHYLLTIYFPSFLLVLLSCFLFWMPLQSLAERTFFGAFLFLAMIIVHSNAQYGTPKTSYLRALDVWTVSCLFFLTIAIIEVLVLHLVAKGSGFSTNTEHVELVNEEGGSSQTAIKLGPFTLEYAMIKRVDLILSLVYPAAWIFFNIVYWGIYHI